MLQRQKEYTTEEVNSLREQLAESEWEGLRDRDLKQILWDGCIGWTQMEDDTVISHYEETYGVNEPPFDGKYLPFTPRKD